MFLSQKPNKSLNRTCDKARTPVSLSLGVLNRRGGRITMKFKETKIAALLVVVFLLVVISRSVYAEDLTVPHVFSPGTAAKSSEVNENFAAIYSELNALRKQIITSIGVIEASYGSACGDAKGNVTGIVAIQCNGKAKCDVLVSNSVFGDPFPGCQKDFNVTWTCGSVQHTWDSHGYYEEQSVQLICP